MLNKQMVLAGLAALVMVSNGAWAAGALEQSTPDAITKGKAAYETSCKACHGANHDGMGDAGKYMNPKPRNLLTEKFKKGDTPQALFKSISEGLPGTSMTGFGHLSPEDRWGLVHYVLSLRKGKK